MEAAPAVGAQHQQVGGRGLGDPEDLGIRAPGRHPGLDRAPVGGFVRQQRPSRTVAVSIR